MMTEHGMNIDREALEEVLSKADVLTIGFTLFPQRILVDTRTNTDTGTFAGMVDPVATVQERYLWLGRHRGMFGAPQAFSFFVWPHTVRGLIQQDALRTLKARLASLDGDGLAQLERVLDQALALESEEFKQAIRGQGQWKTLWQRA